MSIKIKDLKRDSIMNLYRNFKSLDEIQTVMHMAFPDLGFITTNVKNSINFWNLNQKSSFILNDFKSIAKVIARSEANAGVFRFDRRKIKKMPQIGILLIEVI